MPQISFRPNPDHTVTISAGDGKTVISIAYDGMTVDNPSTPYTTGPLDPTRNHDFVVKVNNQPNFSYSIPAVGSAMTMTATFRNVRVDVDADKRIHMTRADGGAQPTIGKLTDLAAHKMGNTWQTESLDSGTYVAQFDDSDGYQCRVAVTVGDAPTVAINAGR
jgi:hypothetical protein